jgi:hypothetical protein
MYNYNEQIVQFHLYERPLTDRVDFVLQEKVNSPEKLNKDEILLLAQYFFLQDNDYVKYDQFSRTVRHDNIMDYLIFNPDIKNIWLSKLGSLKDNLYDNYKYKLVLLLLLFSLCVRSLPIGRGKILIAFFAFLAIPLILNLIYITPDRFLSPYINAGILCGLMALYSGKTIKLMPKWNMLMFIMILLSVLHIRYELAPAIKVLKDKEAGALSVMSAFRDDNREARMPIIYSKMTEDVLPARLFYMNKSTNWVFADAGIFNYYKHVSTYNEVYFGSTINDFGLRIKKIADEEGYIYSDDYMMRFLYQYLLLVRGIKISYIVETPATFHPSDFKKYKLTYKESI